MADPDEFNPMRLWREWLIKSEKMFSDGMTEVMGDERFSKGMGRYMQEMLHTHKMMTDSFAQYLTALNLPSRGDILDISDRIGQMEDALAQTQVELRQLRTQIASMGSDSVQKKPSRSKKPPQATQ
ncbi:MAG: hypothetical protein AAF384_12905 [Pseudomonadota bacterium]